MARGKKIIEKYVHDFRDMAMSQNELQEMLENCVKEILAFLVVQENENKEISNNIC